MAKTTLADIARRQAEAPKVDFSRSVGFSLSESETEVLDEYKHEVLSFADNVCEHLRGAITVASDVIRAGGYDGQDCVEAMESINREVAAVEHVRQSLLTEKGIIELSREDAYNEEYARMFEGTVADRTVRAQSKTKVESYLIFVLDQRIEAINIDLNHARKTVKMLENALWRGIKDS